MDKYDWKITAFFTAEILAFISAGVSINLKEWASVAIFLLLAMLIAGYTGKLIGDNAVRKYKEEKDEES